jgi:hypothetical protein
LSEGLYSEEMQCLNRPLAEISINAAYLQIADEAEIDSYLRYDSLATARVVQKTTTSTLTPDPLDQAEKQRIRQLLAQPTNNSGWSAKNVLLRARAIDKECGVDFMTSTALVVYNLTHLAVHGTAGSVAKVGDWVLSGSDRNDPDRLRSTVVALSGTAVCLMALADFARQRYQLGLDGEMKRFQEKMNI